MNRDFPFGCMSMVSRGGAGDFLSDRRFGKAFSGPQILFF